MIAADATTLWPSEIFTIWLPTFLIWPGVLIAWRSMSKPTAALIAVATSLSVTEPNKTPLAPTFTLAVIVADSSFALISLA